MARQRQAGCVRLGLLPGGGVSGRGRGSEGSFGRRGSARGSAMRSDVAGGGGAAAVAVATARGGGGGGPGRPFGPWRTVTCCWRGAAAGAGGFPVSCCDSCSAGGAC